MANYYQELSFIISLPEDQAKDLVGYIDHIGEVLDEGEDQTGFEAWPNAAKLLEESDDHIGFNAVLQEDGSVWIYGSEGPNIELIIAVLEAAVERFDIKDPIGFQWSNSCSKPRTDAFGGGAAVIGRNAKGQVESRTMDTGQAILDMSKDLASSMPETCWVLRSTDFPGSIREADGGWTQVTKETVNPKDTLSAAEAKAINIDKSAIASVVWVEIDRVEGEIPEAGIHSDDHMIEGKVDIRPWLEQASYYDLESLATSDWGFSEEADNVAHFLSLREDPTVERVMNYLDLDPESVSGDKVGFGLWTDGDSVMAWLEANRPDVHGKLKEVLDGEPQHFEGPM